MAAHLTLAALPEATEGLSDQGPCGSMPPRPPGLCSSAQVSGGVWRVRRTGKVGSPRCSSSDEKQVIAFHVPWGLPNAAPWQHNYRCLPPYKPFLCAAQPSTLSACPNYKRPKCTKAINTGFNSNQIPLIVNNGFCDLLRVKQVQHYFLEDLVSLVFEQCGRQPADVRKKLFKRSRFQK